MIGRGATFARYSRTPSNTRSRWIGEGLPSAFGGYPSTMIASNVVSCVLPRGIVTYAATTAPNPKTATTTTASKTRFVIDIRTQHNNRWK